MKMKKIGIVLEIMYMMSMRMIFQIMIMKKHMRLFKAEWMNTEPAERD